MKYITLFTAILICLASCSSQKYMHSGVNLLSENDGTITVRSIGLGKNKKEAITKAEQNAIKVLLFRGLPSSQQNESILPINESEAISVYDRYFEEFFNEGRYRTFIMSSIPIGSFSKNGKTEREIPVDVKINLKALKRDLEAQGVIRKFGY